jgi:WD domain, G-beta repeat
MAGPVAAAPPRVADGLICPVTALCFVTSVSSTGDVEAYLCAGFGPSLRIYALCPKTHLPSAPASPTAAPLLSRRVLPVSIHGIISGSLTGDAGQHSLILHGNRYVAASVPLRDLVYGCCGRVMTATRAFPDWVLATRSVPQADVLLVALAHGHIHVTDPRTLSTRRIVSCADVEQFWSMSLHIVERICGKEGKGKVGSVCAAAGTSFGQVVLWRMSLTRAEVEKEEEEAVASDVRLRGHDGPVMRTMFSADAAATWLASASVDRSVRLWRRDDVEGGALAYAPYATLYGHAARVWQVALCPAISASGAASPPKLLSVSEDRTLRLWDAANPDGQEQEDVFDCHGGGNAWTVAVCASGDHGKLCAATGGDDGMIQMREIALTSGGDDAAEGQPANGDSMRIESDAEEGRPSDGIDTCFERLKRPGTADESVQSIVLVSSLQAFATTSFGRILVGHVSQGAQTRWTVLYAAVKVDESERLVAFAPNSLVLSGGFLFAGTTEGLVVAGKLYSDSTVLGCVSSFLAFGADSNPRIVSGLFASSIEASDEGDSESIHIDLYAASLTGALHHWRIQASSLEAEHVVTYAHGRTVRHSQVTAVLVLPTPLCGILVGDRRGFLHLYSGSRELPIGYCRPHKDRLSSLVCASPVVRCADDSVMGGSVAIFSTGFDGRLVETHVIAPLDFRLNASSLPAAVPESPSSLTIASSLRCAHRLESLIQVTCRRLSPEQTSAVEASRPVVIGFRGSTLIAHCVSTRTDLFHANVGGWRRALSICTQLELKFAPASMAVAFWRSGLLRVACHEPPSTASLGVPFHGLRAHAASFICSNRDMATSPPTAASVDLMTASEDTSVRVTRLFGCSRADGTWTSKQILSSHQSGATSMSARIVDHNSGAAVAASGGGMDEVAVWARRQGDGAWSLALLHTPTDTPDRRQPRHRVMCLQLALLQRNRVALLVGRSDGSVALSELLLDCDGGWTWADAARVGDAHAGAILSCSWENARSECSAAPRILHCVSGDSAGRTCLWSVTAADTDESTTTCNALTLRLLGAEDGIHTAGVNAVACAAEEDDDDNTLVVASAGDDEKVAVRRFARNDFGAARECARFGAAAVGVILGAGGRAFAAVGADQALLHGCCWGGPLRRRATAVADPAGLIVVPRGGSGGAGEEGIQVAVFGVGLEVLTLD